MTTQINLSETEQPCEILSYFVTRAWKDENENHDNGQEQDEDQDHIAKPIVEN